MKEPELYNIERFLKRYMLPGGMLGDFTTRLYDRLFLLLSDEELVTKCIGPWTPGDWIIDREYTRWFATAPVTELREWAADRSLNWWRTLAFLRKQGAGLPDAAGRLAPEEYARVLLIERDGGYNSQGKWLALWDHRSRRPWALPSGLPYDRPKAFRDKNEYERSKRDTKPQIITQADAARVASYLRQDGYYEQIKAWCRRESQLLAEEMIDEVIFRQLPKYKGKDRPGRGIVMRWCRKYAAKRRPYVQGMDEGERDRITYKHEYGTETHPTRSSDERL